MKPNRLKKIKRNQIEDTNSKIDSRHQTEANQETDRRVYKKPKLVATTTFDSQNEPILEINIPTINRNTNISNEMQTANQSISPDFFTLAINYPSQPTNKNKSKYEPSEDYDLHTLNYEPNQEDDANDFCNNVVEIRKHSPKKYN